MLIRIIEDDKIIIESAKLTAAEEARIINDNLGVRYMSIKPSDLPISPDAELHQYSLYGGKYKWEDGEIVVDTEANELDKQLILNEESKRYLNSTDWYLTRQLESGVATPADILTKRQSARDNIVE